MLRAYSEKYQRQLPEECVEMCRGISSGFGCGHICAALVSSIMAMGMAFPIEDMPRLRIEFLDRFYEEYGTLVCPKLKAENECVDIVSSAAGIADSIIAREIKAEKDSLEI